MRVEGVKAATPKFEVKRSGASGHSNDFMHVPFSGYFASNFAGAAHRHDMFWATNASKDIGVSYPFVTSNLVSDPPFTLSLLQNMLVGSVSV